MHRDQTDLILPCIVGFSDLLSSQHSTRHQLCSQLFESVHGGPLESALDGCEAHTLLHQRNGGVWIRL